MQDILTFYPPKKNIIGFISIPHSGMHIPQEFKDYITNDNSILNEDVDYMVHQLIDIEQLNQAGVAVLVSHIHRTCVDLNRSEDLAIVAWKKNSKQKQIEIKAMGPKLNELMLKKYHRPYFKLIDSTIDNLLQNLKIPSIIDLHSMPSKPTEYHLKITPNQPKHRPDFCISDISGISCEKKFIDHIYHDLAAHYPNITQNVPYYGGYITRYIHQKYDKSVNNIQIEIGRHIYMDEQKKELIKTKVDKLRPILTRSLIDQFIRFKLTD
ncbi:MAG: N-formylglutamate amidohydrolase [Bacteriovoracaceae bacterium]|jgi:N-formylglutamate amidohydrolase|nr:N-formylglutamate amidohydrolase [Bacteriovoracaceae bacterium]